MEKMIIACSILVVLAGCSGRLKQFEQELNPRISSMTYDEALEKYGMPVNIVEGDTIFIVAWQLDASTSATAIPAGNSFIMFQVPNGEVLQLTFNKPAKTLKSWRYTRY